MDLGFKIVKSGQVWTGFGAQNKHGIASAEQHYRESSIYVVTFSLWVGSHNVASIIPIPT